MTGTAPDPVLLEAPRRRTRDDAPTCQVALLRPPVVIAVGNLTAIGLTPPVGIAYIAAALEQAGHRVTVIDAPGEAMDSFEHLPSSVGTIRRIGLTPQEMVERIPPDTRVIGITHMFIHEWPTVRELAELARRRFPDATIVIGGENATGFAPWILEQAPSVDAVVLGEGEGTVVSLVDHVLQGAPYAGMAGLLAREGDGTLAEGGLPVRQRKLGEIARPAWHLFPMDGYFSHRNYLGVDRGRSMPILGTRGCPYKCSFCSSPRMWTTRYLVREPDDIADEIADYVERFGIRNVDFVDLTPMTKRSWILALCDAIEARGLHVSMQLPIGTRSEAMDALVLRRLKEAGLTNITFAPESGSPRMLEIFDKRADLDHILESIRLAEAEGLVTKVHMIFGHPEETWHDRWLSLKFLIRAAFAGVHDPGAALFHPYPGSKDFIDLVEAGKLRIDDDYCYAGLDRDAPPTVALTGGNARVLYLVRATAMLLTLSITYVLHPSRLVRLVRTLVKGGDEHNLVEATINSRRRGPMKPKARSAVTP